MLQRVTKVTLADRIALILLRYILEEELKEGDQLPAERELAATLGVSQHVLREALGILVGQGVIIKEHGRGVFVRAFDREYVQAEMATPGLETARPDDLHAARIALEIGMMALVVQRATDADIAALEASIEGMRRKVATGASVTSEDLQFHQALVKATHNHSLQHLRGLIAESMRQRVYEAPGLLHRQVKEESHIIPAHQAIVDAIRSRDGARATQAMYAHLENSLGQLIDESS